MKAFIQIKPGEFVRHNSEKYAVLKYVDLESVLCRHLSSGETRTLNVHELKEDAPHQKKIKKDSEELTTVDQQEWENVTRKTKELHDLMADHQRGTINEKVTKVAREFNRSVSTIYRWMSALKNDGTASALLKTKREDKGKTRLSKEVENIISTEIKKTLLKQEFGTIKRVHFNVKRICEVKNLKVPSLETIRARFLSVSEKERVANRVSKKAAKQQFTPVLGEFPGAEYPLAVIQIDHTPVDLMIVDDVHRKSIGRPYLTIAIDVFSRVLMGFSLSLDAPSMASVGLCLQHAFTPKEEWLKALKIKAEWPCYGRPRKIHTDNAKEFRGNVLGRACENYGITLEQRPRGSPNFGGTVERSFRTFMREVHGSEGTTFSNIRSKFEYDSEGRALLTLNEFLVWFTTYITKVYHVSAHKGIDGNTPLARFKEGILGTDERPGIGLPERFSDPERLRLDFLPYFERTVQREGVLIDHIHYFDDVLRQRIGERDPNYPKYARKFIFRRDPIDVSVIYFWDPDLFTYREIPCAHRGRPPTSLWEIKAVLRDLRDKGKKNVQEDVIFEGLQEMREIERDAAQKQKLARRREQHRREHEGKRKKANKIETTQQESLPDAESKKYQSIGLSQAAIVVTLVPDEDEVIEPFDEIEVAKK